MKLRKFSRLKDNGETNVIKTQFKINEIIISFAVLFRSFHVNVYQLAGMCFDFSFQKVNETPHCLVFKNSLPNCSILENHITNLCVYNSQISLNGFICFQMWFTYTFCFFSSSLLKPRLRLPHLHQVSKICY